MGDRDKLASVLYRWRFYDIKSPNYTRARSAHSVITILRIKSTEDITLRPTCLANQIESRVLVDSGYLKQLPLVKQTHLGKKITIIFQI